MRLLHVLPAEFSRQLVSEQLVSQLAVPITRRFEKAGQSATSTLVYRSISQR
jgi:hypothetical protein